MTILRRVQVAVSEGADLTPVSLVLLPLLPASPSGLLAPHVLSSGRAPVLFCFCKSQHDKNIDIMKLRSSSQLLGKSRQVKVREVFLRVHSTPEQRNRCLLTSIGVRGYNIPTHQE